MIPFKYLLFAVPGLVAVAFLTLIERKVLGLVGLRLGPNKVFVGGIFQPFTDAIKLGNKQCNTLFNFSFFFYYLNCLLIMTVSLSLYTCFFLDPQLLSLKHSFLLFVTFLGINSLRSILLGWSVFRKFCIMGSLRTVSQLISYESVIYFCFIFFVAFFNILSFENHSSEGLIFFVLLSPCFYIWIPSILADLNRTPYDFSEGERELVRGFNTEFGSSGFTLIFLREYNNILFFSFLRRYLFFGSTSSLIFFFFFFFLTIWLRSVLPRFRFDKLIGLAWKFLIPFLTFYFIWFIFPVF